MECSILGPVNVSFIISVMKAREVERGSFLTIFKILATDGSTYQCGELAGWQLVVENRRVTPGRAWVSTM